VRPDGDGVSFVSILRTGCRGSQGTVSLLSRFSEPIAADLEEDLGTVSLLSRFSDPSARISRAAGAEKSDKRDTVPIKCLRSLWLALENRDKRDTVPRSSVFGWGLEICGDLGAAGALLAQVLGEVGVVAAQGLGHRCAAVVGTRVELGACGEEKVDEVAIAVERGLLEGGEAVRLSHQRIGAALEQELGGRELVGEQRGLQRGVLELGARAGVDVDAAIEKEAHCLRVAGERGEVERAPAPGAPGGGELGIGLELPG